MDVKRIGVVGAGTMGRGIAQVCAASGFAVVMSDVSTDAVTAGLAAIGKQLVNAETDGLARAHPEQAFGGRIDQANPQVAVEQQYRSAQAIEQPPIVDAPLHGLLAHARRRAG